VNRTAYMPKTLGVVAICAYLNKQNWQPGLYFSQILPNILGINDFNA
jgi:hypothetical protein